MKDSERQIQQKSNQQNNNNYSIFICNCLYLIRFKVDQPMTEAKRLSTNSMEIEVINQRNTPQIIQTRYKSAAQMILMGCVISLSAVMFGYGLAEISTIPIQVLVENYGIDFLPSVAQGLLIGIMPAGGIFGAALNPIILAFLKRRTSIFFISVFMAISVGLVQITTVETLFIGRFLQGICIGLYVSIGAIYLREIAARQLRSQVSAIFSLGKVFGIVLAYSLQHILDAVNYEYKWRILLCFNGIICIIQAILIFFFIPESPVEMVEKSDFVEAKKSILKLYNQKYADQVLNQMKKDYQAEIARTKPADKVQMLLAAAVSYTKNRKRAMLMAIHIVVLRQFIGGNVLVTFSGQIVDAFNKLEGFWTPLVVNILQLIANFFAVSFITKKFGRRPLFLFGTLTLCLFNFALVAVLILRQQILILIFMSLYMIVYGGSFLPVSWSYPSEIVAAEQSVIPNVIGWIATAIVTSIPPIVVGAMPNGNAYPLFIFFGCYGIFGVIMIYLKLIESKGKTYEQIIAQY